MRRTLFATLLLSLLTAAGTALAQTSVTPKIECNLGGIAGVDECPIGASLQVGAGRVLDVAPGARTLSADNLIINPCALIDQRNEGGTVSNAYTADRWKSVDSSVAVNASRVINNAAGSPAADCASYMKLAVGTQTTPAASDFRFWGQTLRSGDTLDLAYGTTHALSLMLEFDAISLNAGARTVVLQNPNAGFTYAMTYALAAATAKHFVFVIPGDPTNFLAQSVTAAGLKLLFDTGDGHCTATQNAWVSGTFQCITGNEQLVTEANTSTLFISSVKLYKGSFVLPVSRRSYSREMDLAQQFVRKTFPIGTAPVQGTAGVVGALCGQAAVVTAGSFGVMWTFPPMVQAAGTVTTYNPSAANANWRDVGGASDAIVNIDPAAAKGPTGVNISEQTTALVVGHNYCIHALVDFDF